MLYAYQVKSALIEYLQTLHGYSEWCSKDQYMYILMCLRYIYGTLIWA